MISVENVTKTYGDFTAVDGVSFTAQPGRITGFLGPNGAGKSTTLRVLVGLTPAERGTALVLGRRYADLPNPGLDVGVLLDASAQHAGRTGREVLTIAQQTMGLPRARVDTTLELVGLNRAEAARRLRDYSLGMRQRLGLAHALLGSPRVLILDEPANGLDPAGIRWMRDLLRGYADRGATVLLSSHLLHEIEVVADDLVVIGQGRVVAAGMKADLLTTSGTQVVARNEEGLRRALTAARLKYHETAHHDRAQHYTAFRIEAEPEHVGDIAQQAGISLTQLSPAAGTNLEEMFLALTAQTQRETVPSDSAHASKPHQQGAVA